MSVCVSHTTYSETVQPIVAIFSANVWFLRPFICNEWDDSRLSGSVLPIHVNEGCNFLKFCMKANFIVLLEYDHMLPLPSAH